MPRWLAASRSLARRALPLTMAVVVVVFVAATLYSQFLLTTDVDALAIAANGAPSVAALADARGELRTLGFIAAHGDARAGWDEHRRRLEEAIAANERTPTYPGEAELEHVVRQELAQLDQRAHAPYAELETAIDELDAGIAALSSLNRRYLVEAAQSIGRMGRLRNFYALLLDGLAIVISLLATFLAARTVNRYFATMDRRARELEHLAIQVGHDIANPLTPIQVALLAAARNDGHAAAAVERAQRSVVRIEQTIRGLARFAQAGMTPPTPPPRAALAPALAEAARAAGCTVDAGELEVAFAEPALRELLGDLVAASAPPNGDTITAVEVAPVGRCVRISIVRPAHGGDGANPFDPQLHVPGADYPGIDLRLATVRRAVQAAGGGVGVRRARGRETLWIELLRA